MTDHKNENLDELLSRFYDETQAGQVKNDIRSGDELLASFPAPPPPQTLINNINAEFDKESARKSRTAYYKIAAAIAALIIIIFNLLPSTGPIETPPITMTTDTILDNGSIFSETDVDLALLSAEIENIEMSILALRLDETENGTGLIDDYIDDLETQLTEIETIFWKG